MSSRPRDSLPTVTRQRREIARHIRDLAIARETLAMLRHELAVARKDLRNAIRQGENDAKAHAYAAAATERDLDAALERLGRVSRERDELRATLDAVAAMVRR